jgi:hypothetical protein
MMAVVAVSKLLLVSPTVSVSGLHKLKPGIEVLPAKVWLVLYGTSSGPTTYITSRLYEVKISIMHMGNPLRGSLYQMIDTEAQTT